MTNVDEIIASNLVEKDDMRTELSRDDAGVVQYNFFRKERLGIKLKQITVNVNNINDSFYLNSTTNGVLNTNILGDRRTTSTTLSTTITINI
jgi:uncharacterized protein (UPF0128 family)